MIKKCTLILTLSLILAFSLVACKSTSNDPFEKGESEENLIAFELNQNTIKLQVDKQYDIKKNILLFAVNYNELQFQSNDLHIATIDDDGIITAISEGVSEIDIQYTGEKGQSKKSFAVRVVDLDITIDEIVLPSYILNLGETIAVDVTFNYSDAGLSVEDVDFYVKTGREYLLEIEGTNALKVVGCGEGIIQASLKKDPTISKEISFITDFTDKSVGEAIRKSLFKPAGYITKQELSNLNEIDLTGVLIKKIDDLLLLNGLKTLKLSRTNLRDFSFIAAFKELEKIELANNLLNNADFLMANIKLEYIDLSNNSLKELCLPNTGNLKTVLLQNNQLTNFDFLNDATQLQKLDISKNNALSSSFLQKLFFIEELNISYNANITNLSFLEGKELLVKLVADNCKIASIGNLSSMLKYLSVSNNKLTGISFLTVCSNLEYINLGRNNIANINALNNFGKIKYLIMPNNLITSIEPIQKSVNLLVIDIANNNVNNKNTILTNEVLAKFLLLEEAYIGGNTNISDISFLKSESVKTNIKRLNIGNINISENIVKDIVSKLSNLEWLEVYKLNLTSCEYFNSSNLPKLVYIKISHNSITNYLPLLHVKYLVKDYEEPK